MISSLDTFLPISLPMIQLDDIFPDCLLCDAGSARKLNREPMIQCVGDPEPDILFISDPPDAFAAMQGAPCISPILDFITDTFNASMIDVVAAGNSPLSFAIVPVIGCSAQALNPLELKDTKCVERAVSFIDQLDPGLIIFLSKASSAFIPTSIPSVCISGVYALSKLNSRDMDVRHTSDVLKIRQAVCRIWEVTFYERSRPSSLESI